MGTIDSIYCLVCSVAYLLMLLAWEMSKNTMERVTTAEECGIVGKYGGCTGQAPGRQIKGTAILRRSLGKDSGLL